jgi:hypothetical protein
MPPFMAMLWAKLCKPWMMLQLRDHMERGAWYAEQERNRRFYNDGR